MKFSTAAAVAALAAPALAQSSSNSSANMTSSSNSSAYLQAVLGALTQANLTGLVSAASAIANTSDGMAFLGMLAQGNKTVFAPSNEAFSKIDQSMFANTSLVTQLLSYHVLNNTYTVNGTNVSPNHTIGRTLLSGGEYMLPSNRSAPLVLDRNSTNATYFNIVQATDNVTAMGPVAAGNLMLYVIDEVLSLPMDVGSAANMVAPALGSLLNQTMLAEPLEMSNGITVFAPNDGALAAVMGALGNVSAMDIEAILLNHVINGSVVYSTDLYNYNYTSAGGEPFTFMRNGSQWMVKSGNSTANIVQSDIILNNGVMYVIDNVLVNTQMNQTAAAAADQSYMSIAATAQETNAPVTATSSAGGAGSTGGSGSKSGASAQTGLGKTLVGGIVGVVGLLAGFVLM